MLSRALQEAGLADRIEVGSAGTSWESEGMPMDPRTLAALERAGYETSGPGHAARSIHLGELRAWDLALAMTAAHAEALRRTADQIPPDLPRPDVRMWREFDGRADVSACGDELDVPDPWYEGRRGFDRTIRIMQRSLPSLVLELRMRLERAQSSSSSRRA